MGKLTLDYDKGGCMVVAPSWLNIERIEMNKEKSTDLLYK